MADLSPNQSAVFFSHTKSALASQQYFPLIINQHHIPARARRTEQRPSGRVTTVRERERSLLKRPLLTVRKGQLIRKLKSKLEKLLLETQSYLDDMGRV